MPDEIYLSGNWLNRLDLSAAPDLDDKHKECEFFFKLLSLETDRNQFRWLVSAFLNSVYSYFETSALTAHFSLTHPVTDEPMEDPESLKILREYVKITQNKKNPNYVKTGAVHPVVKEVYELRKKALTTSLIRLWPLTQNCREASSLGICEDRESLLSINVKEQYR